MGLDRSDRVSVAEAAKLLGVSRQAVYGLIKRGVLESEWYVGRRCVRVGSVIERRRRVQRGEAQTRRRVEK